MAKTWKRVLIGVNFLLVTGCIISGVFVGRQILQAKEDFNSEVLVLPSNIDDTSKPATRPPFDYYRIISDRQLFGAPPKNLPEGSKTLSEKEIANLPKTSLQLSLKATVAFEDPKFSFAIIEDLKTRKQELYKIGNKIADAEVVSIYPDKVVLKRADKEEVLILFDEEKLAASSAGKGKSSAADTSSKSKPAEIVKPSKVSENKWVIKGDEINQAVKAAPQVLSQANIAPYQPSDKVEGFKIDNIQAGSLYEQYGLKNGDVIKRVNGEVIDGLDKAISLGQKFLSEGVSSVAVEIERGGSIVTLNYDIKR